MLFSPIVSGPVKNMTIPGAKIQRPQFCGAALFAAQRFSWASECGSESSLADLLSYTAGGGPETGATIE